MVVSNSIDQVSWYVFWLISSLENRRPPPKGVRRVLNWGVYKEVKKSANRKQKSKSPRTLQMALQWQNLILSHCCFETHKYDRGIKHTQQKCQWYHSKNKAILVHPERKKKCTLSKRKLLKQVNFRNQGVGSCSLHTSERRISNRANRSK